MSALSEIHRTMILSELRALFDQHAQCQPMSDMFLYHFGESPEDCLTRKRIGGCARSKIFLFLSAVFGNSQHQSVSSLVIAQELIHQASLIIDDIADQAKCRKNEPTLWSAHGIPSAFNFAQWLLFTGMSKLAAASPEHCGRFLSSALSLVAAQQSDMSANWGRSYSEYQSISREKTGRLYSFAAHAACLLASRNEDELVSTIDHLMCTAGICHQICDDLADASSLESNRKAFGDCDAAIERNVRQSIFSVGEELSDGTDLFEFVASRITFAQEKLAEEINHVESIIERCRELLWSKLMSSGRKAWTEEFVPLLKSLVQEENAI